MTFILKAQPLTKESFAPFGEVVETEGAKHFPINRGTVERYHHLAQSEIDDQGNTIVSIVEVLTASTLDLKVDLVERHPLGSQAFIPIDASSMCVVVAKPGETVEPESLQAFVSNGQQGINYFRGTWHMPLVAFETGKRFLVVDRGGPGHNCEERPFEQDVRVDSQSIKTLIDG